MRHKLLLAALVGLALAGCTHDDGLAGGATPTPTLTQHEIAIRPFGRKMSRGYVMGTDFRQYPGYPLARHMYLSAYNATEGTDYFISKTFGEKIVTTGDPATPTGTGIWGAVTPTGDEANPWQPEPMYWPFGTTLDFLAYSQSYDVEPWSYVVGSRKASAGGPICPKILANWKSANEVELEVTRDSRQDDILYAATSGLNPSNSGTATGFSMTFDHAQAWLTFRLMLSEDSDLSSELKINSIECIGVYDCGRLTLRNEGGGKASATWNFFPQRPANVAVDYYHDELTHYLSLGHPIELNTLLPPQEHQGFIINYTMSGSSITSKLLIPVDKLRHEGDDPEAAPRWEAGVHYTYNFMFTLGKITIAPYVTVWEGGDEASPSEPITDH